MIDAPRKLVARRSELLELLREAATLCDDDSDVDVDLPDLSFRIHAVLAREEDGNSHCPTCGSLQEDEGE